ncbi:anthranilate phosphoribosyltransferase [Hyaloraphidium curvatum]|nr:anthranilate phosphoribosyltransferase [Hyaloraphidium curvatum]
MQAVLKQLTAASGGDFTDAARTAFRHILDNTATPAQAAAFLVGLKLHGRDHDPRVVAACATVMRDHALQIPFDAAADADILDSLVDIVGTGGDGHNTFNVSTASSLVAAGAGCVVAKHGNRAASSSSGSADVLESLGCQLTNILPDNVPAILRRCRFAFLFAQTYHPAMKHVAPIRREIGIPTIFNLLGPLTNPAKPRRVVVGVHSKALGPLMAESLLLLGVERGMVVHGTEGLDEISPERDTLVWLMEDGKIKEMTLSPADFGLSSHPLASVSGGSPAENAETMRALLSNKLEGPIRDFVLMNSAALLFVSGKAPSLPEAVDLARRSIEGGAALKVLEEFARQSKELAS